MHRKKRQRLEAAGWKVGSTQEFLELTDEEAALVEAQVGLTGTVDVSTERPALNADKLRRHSSK